MNGKNALHGEAWDNCQRCGFQFPVSYLVMQLGLRVCEICVDNLDVVNREAVIARILQSEVAAHPEGADMRYVDLAYFEDPELDTQA